MVYLIAVLGRCLTSCFGESQLLNKIIIACTAIAWRVTLFFCFWIHTDIEAEEDPHDMCSSGRAAVLIANHTSFMDTILILSMLPLRHSVNAKQLVAEYVFQFPFLGTIVTAMGHLPVAFKAKGQPTTAEELNDMSVDTEAIAAQQRKMEEHVANNGIAVWYPEGKMNPADCSQLMTFRAGGMALPVKQDVEIWCIAVCGTAACWPRRAAVGGFPSGIGVRMFRFCDSSGDYLAAALPPGADDRAKAMQLATATQSAIQDRVSELVQKGFNANRLSDSGDVQSQHLLPK
eukprot:TRINITY_DN12496_c0_g1_i3.p1 TRINITY_DN12496_c0_g1~~TRINITY_DN12496_c0_g1_i3.p1  ORF type:complete len:289 (+),score=52.27 TRINITY_DN12496_c0_g1_i3:295-1161(+)